MGTVATKFSEGIYFSNNKENRVKNDFYFNFFVSGNPHKKNDERYPKIYILGLERLFKKDESIGITMDHFAKAFNTNGNDDWNISYGESPYGKCIIVTCVADNIKENLSVACQLSYRYEFTADFQDKDSIGVTVHFENFDTIYSDLDNIIEQNSIITAYEKPFIETFDIENIDPKNEIISDSAMREITWSFGNIEKVTASLCDENDVELANTPPYRTRIYKNRKFKLIAEKNGYKVFQTLSVFCIRNADDWDAFADEVNEGNTYADMFVILGADISVQKKIGDSDKKKFFSGTFDGNGHTIKATIEDKSKPGLALFQDIHDATIKNLTVDGTITGGIHAAGLVGYAVGTDNRIENCVVMATISNNETHIGGILGHGLSSNIVIDNCVFKGILEGGSTAKGVFFGWGENGGTKIVTNGLYIMKNEQDTVEGKKNLDLVQLNNGSVNVKDCYKTKDVGSCGKIAYLAKPTNRLSIKKTASDGTDFYITEDSSSKTPFMINNEADWKVFAKSVSDGITYAGEFIKLNADITVSQKIGDSDNEKFFSGTFDGNGHTIKATIEDKSKPGLALFHKIQGATIKNLIVDGSITGGKHAAGLVGYAAEADNRIKNCVVKATISNDETHIGGILGHGRSSNIVIDNCVFKGILEGGSTAKGIFFGWGDNGGTKIVTNCLYIQQNGQKTNNLDLAQMDAGSVNVKDCYKTENIGTYGKRAYLTKPSDCTIKKTAIDGTKFYVVALPSENDHYIINNNDDWNVFAKAVSDGITFVGELIKLNADITVSQKIGDSDNEKFFSGTFDGNGHTIKANIEEHDEDYVALFSTINGATIKNLIVAGTITGEEHTAGIVGCSIGSENHIENCIVTATINGYYKISGILGYGKDGDITINNCVFKGLLIGDDSTSISTFIGEGDGGGTQRVSNSLYIMQKEQLRFFPIHGDFDLVHFKKNYIDINFYNDIITNCYKTEEIELPGEIGFFGIRAYLTKPSDFSTIEKTAIDGTKFYVVAFPSENDHYIINNNDDWNVFAKAVSDGITFAGKFIQLNANISVSQEIGNGIGIFKFFSGTFDGNGYTINANIEGHNKDYVALFNTINGATIKNLTVAGKITGRGFLAGIVGRSIGSGNKIEKCIVTAIINGGRVGGILGSVKVGDITIDNCVFKGLLIEAASTSIRAFIGEGGTGKVSNSLYILQEGQVTKHLDLADGCVDITDCYKTADIGMYGQLAYLTKPSDFTTIEKTAIDGTKFYVKA